MHTLPPLPVLALPTLLLPVVLMIGCSDDSARVAVVAHYAPEAQAEQNKELARLSGEVVDSSQRLVEQDARARMQIIAAQQNLQTQHSDLGQQHDDVEIEGSIVLAIRRPCVVEIRV